MNKTALYAILLALLLPLAAYFVVKKQSEKAIAMPRHYFPDSVVTRVKKNKKIVDTVWHSVGDFSFKNQDGHTVTWDHLKGKIVIASFFFTRCPTICPTMTRNMKRIATSLHNGQKTGDKTNKKVHFISFSVDPERDSVPQLKKWADRFQINPEQWWLLTGDKKAIYDFSLQEIKLGLVDGEGADSNFIHSEKFVLIDSNRHIRGYYNGLDSVSLAKLSGDLVLLSMEKDPNKKSFFSGKLQLLAVVFLLSIFGIGLFFYIIRKKSR